MLRIAWLFGGRACFRTRGSKPGAFPILFYLPRPVSLGETCRIRRKDQGVNHSGGHTASGEEEGQFRFITLMPVGRFTQAPGAPWRTF